MKGSVALPKRRSEATCQPFLQSLFAGEVFFAEGFALDEKIYRKTVLLKKKGMHIRFCPACFSNAVIKYLLFRRLGAFGKLCGGEN